MTSVVDLGSRRVKSGGIVMKRRWMCFQSGSESVKKQVASHKCRGRSGALWAKAERTVKSSALQGF